jgi:protein-tyrosine phosphatase
VFGILAKQGQTLDLQHCCIFSESSRSDDVPSTRPRDDRNETPQLRKAMMVSNESNFKPGRRIDIPSVPNLRDVGGYVLTGGGRVRTGQLYRSVELNHLQGEDLEQFAKLGIRTVFDLRTAAERSVEPDVVPDGTELVICDVLADSQSAASAQLLKVLADPALAEQMLGAGKAVALFERGYREIISLPSALSAYREFFTKIANDAHRPALFHCTTGKDRTGWAAAATLLLLGVSEQDVLYDYELTNRDLLPALKPIFEHFTAAGGDRRLLEPVLGVDPDYLHAALDEMNQKFGSIEAYFTNGLHVDPDAQQQLRNTLTEH